MHILFHHVVLQGTELLCLNNEYNALCVKDCVKTHLWTLEWKMLIYKHAFWRNTEHLSVCPYYVAGVLIYDELQFTLLHCVLRVVHYIIGFIVMCVFTRDANFWWRMVLLSVAHSWISEIGERVYVVLCRQTPFVYLTSSVFPIFCCSPISQVV